MNMNKRAEQLSNRLRQLRQDIALELSLTTNRPEGWLPRMVFVEEDEYEAGFTMYEVLRIHQNGTCDVRPTEGLYIEEKNIPLTEINIDWLNLLLDIYACECNEQGLPEAEIRRCDHCGRPMKEGYYLAGEYACSDECCLALYHGDKKTMDADLALADTDEGECYWTEWESFYTE